MKVREATYAMCLELGFRLTYNTETIDNIVIEKELWECNGKRYRFILMNGTVIDKRRV